MKAIICNKIKEDDPGYFQIGWRIPYEELESIGWISVAQTDITGKISDFFMNKYHMLPSVILFWNTNTFIQNNANDILNNKWIKCIYMDDIHQSSAKVKNYRTWIINNFDYIFSTYAYTFLNFFPFTDPKKIIWYPHNINNKFAVEFNNNPINKISLSGCIDKNIYPFRNYAYKLSTKYPIDVLEQLSYKVMNHNVYGHDYIKYINQYRAAVTCCSTNKTPYIVCKFFEIPASGALLMAYDEFVKEPFQQLGFIDGENYISVNFDNMIDKINYVLDPKNRDIIDKIRKNGYELVWKNHTLMNRVNLIDNKIEN